MNKKSKISPIHSLILCVGLFECPAGTLTYIYNVVAFESMVWNMIVTAVGSSKLTGILVKIHCTYELTNVEGILLGIQVSICEN